MQRERTAAPGDKASPPGNDPWYFQRWAYSQKLGNSTRKLVLGALATMADSETGSCFASQDRLANYAECSVRTVHDHLKAMEAAGLLERRRRSSIHGYRLADMFLLLAPGVTEWPDDTPVSLPADSASSSPAQGLPEVQAAEQERPLTTHREGELTDPSLSENSNVKTLSSMAVGNASREADAERELFDYWRERCNHNPAKFTTERRRKVKARIGEGYTVAQIRQAIDGAARGAYVNDNGHRFDDLELICRSGSKLEQFIARATGNAPAAHPASVQIARWQAMKEAA